MIQQTIYFNDNTSVELATRYPVQLYMQKEDREIWGSVRDCASCPAVFTLKDDAHAFIEEQMQYFIRAINYAMTLDNVALLFDHGLAFANRTGLRNPDQPKADYFHGKDLSYRVFNLDKVRTCSRSSLTGTEEFSLTVALLAAVQIIKAIRLRSAGLGVLRKKFSGLLVGRNALNVWTFDSTQPPPLKPGKTHPRSIQEIVLEDYLYNPRENRERFLVANIVNPQGDVVQFPRGGLYPWTDDNTPYSFVPHISNHTYGKVLYDLDNLIKLPLGAYPPRPYRST